MMNRKASILAVLGLCFAASACTPYAGQDATSLEDSVPRDRSRMVALAGEPAVVGGSTQLPPIVSLPAEAGSVAKVRTRTYADGLRQDIILKSAPGRRFENAIVFMTRTSRRPTLDEQVPLYKPTEAGIRSEIRAHYPGIAMRVADRDLSNSYGPYGLALGRTGADLRCVYMWQWIDANRLPPNAGFAGPASVRVSLCEADMSFDAIAALLDHLAIGAEGLSLEVASIDAPALAPRDERLPRKARKPAQRRAAAAPQPAQPDELRASPYMAPLQSSTPGVAQPSTGARQPSASLTAGLSQDLPPQAYLGPKAASGSKTAAQPGAAPSN